LLRTKEIKAKKKTQKKVTGENPC